jgi:hypothetical protein
MIKADTVKMYGSFMIYLVSMRTNNYHEQKACAIGMPQKDQASKGINCLCYGMPPNRCAKGMGNGKP